MARRPAPPSDPVPELRVMIADIPEGKRQRAVSYAVNIKARFRELQGLLMRSADALSSAPLFLPDAHRLSLEIRHALDRHGVEAASVPPADSPAG